jgi:hypothetical protein
VRVCMCGCVHARVLACEHICWDVGMYARVGVPMYPSQCRLRVPAQLVAPIRPSDFHLALGHVIRFRVRVQVLVRARAKSGRRGRLVCVNVCVCECLCV